MELRWGARGRGEWGDNEKYKVAGFNIRNLNNRFPTPQQSSSIARPNDQKSFYEFDVYFLLVKFSVVIEFHQISAIWAAELFIEIARELFSPLKTWFHLVSLRDSISNSKSDHHHKSTHSTSWDFRFTDRREICCEEQIYIWIYFFFDIDTQTFQQLSRLSVCGGLCAEFVNDPEQRRSTFKVLSGSESDKIKLGKLAAASTHFSLRYRTQLFDVYANAKEDLGAICLSTSKHNTRLRWKMKILKLRVRLWYFYDFKLDFLIDTIYLILNFLISALESRTTWGSERWDRSLTIKLCFTHAFALTPCSISFS